MNEFLLEDFRNTTYHVVLDTVRWASIRIDLPLPAELTAVVGARPWGFITAWNPQARRRPQAENLAAQQALVDALGKLPQVAVYAAIGVGQTGWSEPSLFVIGADVPMLDALMREHAQLSYVHGEAGGPAELRMLA
jgi:hypothetical protein